MNIKEEWYEDSDIIQHLIKNSDYIIFADNLTTNQPGCLSSTGATERLTNYLEQSIKSQENIKTIIPICVEMGQIGHWVALVIEKENNKLLVKYIDPKGGSSLRDAGVNSQQIIKETFPESENYEIRFKNIFTMFQDAPQAIGNNYDCGPLLVDTLNRIILGKDIDYLKGLYESTTEEQMEEITNTFGQNVRHSQANSDDPICYITPNLDNTLTSYITLPEENISVLHNETPNLDSGNSEHHKSSEKIDILSPYKKSLIQDESEEDILEKLKSLFSPKSSKKPTSKSEEDEFPKTYADSLKEAVETKVEPYKSNRQ